KVLLRRGNHEAASAFPVWPYLELESMADTSTAALRGRSLLVGVGLFNFTLAPAMDGSAAPASRGDYVVDKFRC
ncbi:MAG: hypothetical protein OXD34_13985, partial [bacterium]|nr:hypothetical protein [bacterium]